MPMGQAAMGPSSMFDPEFGNSTVSTRRETGAAVAPRSSSSRVGIFSVIAFVGISIGMTMATVGGWTDSSVGKAGIAIFSISFFIFVIVGFMRVSSSPDLQEYAGDLDAGTGTLEGGSTTLSQADETTSYIVQTGALQPGRVAMGTHPGYPRGLTQPYPPHANDYLGAAYPPNPVQPSNVGVVDPTSEGESVPPPPSYDDVIAGNV